MANRYYQPMRWMRLMLWALLVLVAAQTAPNQTTASIASRRKGVSDGKTKSESFVAVGPQGEVEEITSTAEKSDTSLMSMTYKSFNQANLIPIIKRELNPDLNMGLSAGIIEAMRLIAVSEWNKFHEEINNGDLSQKTKVLLAFICNWQTDMIGGTTCRFASLAEGPELTLKLRNGTTLTANNATTLYHQLWQLRSFKQPTIWLGTAQKGFIQPILSQLREEVIYTLQLPTHIMILQKTNNMLVLFNPFTGLLSLTPSEFGFVTEDHQPRTVAISDYSGDYSTTKIEIPNNHPDIYMWIRKAIRANDLYSLKILMEKHSNYNTFAKLDTSIRTDADWIGQTLMNEICLFGAYEIAQEIFNDKTFQHDLNQLDQNDNTLLHRAAKSGEPRLITLLLQNGAMSQLFKFNALGQFPLQSAEKLGKTETAAAIKAAIFKIVAEQQFRTSGSIVGKKPKGTATAMPSM